MAVIVNAPPTADITVADREPAVVALAMPHYGNVKFEAADSFRKARGNPTRISGLIHLGMGGSILTSNFNRAWCAALNNRAEYGVTHFAMLHADVCAKEGWLDVLLGEMERLAADVVSAVLPLKTEHGLTSTAVGCPSNVFANRRLSMHEVYRLPETFCAADLAQYVHQTGPLLVNTGCFLADLRKPWAFDVDESGRLPWAFRFENEIRRDPNTGKYHSFVASEDWLFSRHLADVGARVYATRKVQAFHIGNNNFVNGKPWGTWETDESFAEVRAQVLARAGEPE